KFANAESPENILNILQTVYPTEESHPAYICIDKACLILCHSITNGSWDTWKKTSQLIVDSYHYTNHSTTYFLCFKWCNLAPVDGSAPNLVIVEHDADGVPYYKHAFNTQACEQLNAWLGGFDSILRKMTVGNFNWFLHVMLSEYVTLPLFQLDSGYSDWNFWNFWNQVEFFLYIVLPMQHNSGQNKHQIYTWNPWNLTRLITTRLTRITRMHMLSQIKV
ncbi:hypothetical protein L208DRAFT_1280076, partial [Tricholoma matsutake]